MRLSQATRNELLAALDDAFGGVGDLKRVTSLGLDVRLSRITSPAQDYGAVALDVVEYCEEHDCVDDLILGAQALNPRNAMLHRVACRTRIGSWTPPLPGSKEALYLGLADWKDADPWRASMAAAEQPVCCIRAGRRRVGTGFLVGPNLLITNQHVLYAKGLPPWNELDLKLEFDYKETRSGTTPVRSVTHDLASAVELAQSPDLDYALLRLDSNPGSELVAGQPGNPKRGWLKPLNQQIDSVIRKDHAVFILGHPLGLKLQVSVGRVLGTESQPSRISYTAPTFNGSSGSPCFDVHWSLLALHCEGDANGNRAVPFKAILDDLGEELGAEIG